MSHDKQLTMYCAHFVDELVKSGLREVVISPGSRSTPLAMTMCEHKGINEWVIVDERSAAFFALGLAKKTKRAVALLCTSGTAVANYFPAIVEAHESRIPLVVLTADRPHELRDVGAPQAIDQIKIFGDYVKWFHEMASPESSGRMLSYVRSKASRAVNVSTEGNRGPVHLNFPFREPLIPDFSINCSEESEQIAPYNRIYSGEKKLPIEQLSFILDELRNKQKGLIVCGPEVEAELAEYITNLAAAWNLPIIADPLAQLRTGLHRKENIVETSDAILRNEQIRKSLKPDFIIRFGAMPISKMYLHYLQEHKEVTQFIIEAHEGYRDPVNHATQYIFTDPKLFCVDMIKQLPKDRTTSWLTTWQKMNHIAKRKLAEADSNGLTEGTAVRSLLDVIPSEGSLFVANSMAVRDMDTFLLTTEKEIVLYANRGASGIDGVTSSALGVAATSKHPTTLIIGDLSFYHDLNGLLSAKQYNINLTILLINNNGGGIFSFLPQAKHEAYFEKLFGTPLDIDFKPAVEMYGGTYRLAQDEQELRTQLTQSYTEKGLSVIEVQTDRTENLNWRREVWQTIDEELLKFKESGI